MNAANDQLPWQGVYDRWGITEPAIDDSPLAVHVAQNADTHPNNVALQFLDRDITCSELDRLASQLANALAAQGVTQSDVVGLYMPNIPQYAIALCAISRLGCIGSGVSPLLSPSELRYQIEDAGISVIIAMDALVPSLQEIDPLPNSLRTIMVASPSDLISPQEGETPIIGSTTVQSYLSSTKDQPTHCNQRPVHWNDTFMIQYTGGTTGKPKGAQLTHRNVMHNVAQFSVYVPWRLGQEVAATAFPMFHVAGLLYHVTAMRFAARMLLIPNPRDLDFFCAQMKRFPPTHLAAVPTLYQMLVAHPAFREIDFSNLRHAVTGAAPLTSEDRKSIEGVVGQGKLSDVFGMTETGPVHVENPPGSTKHASIGIPVPGADTRIVDLETGAREMPLGEPGEIITSGPQVMKGYLNLPEESGIALRQWQGKTWMYTGDVGYMDDEGYIYLCDRAKDMLIVGGFKVFSVEVEDKLKALDFIAQSAVVATPDLERLGNDVVNLYVQLNDAAKDQDQAFVAEQIITYCRENMAPYKVPKEIHIIDEIPVTPIGKIDKKTLRALANS